VGGCGGGGGVGGGGGGGGGLCGIDFGGWVDGEGQILKRPNTLRLTDMQTPLRCWSTTTAEKRPKPDFLGKAAITD